MCQCYQNSLETTSLKDDNYTKVKVKNKICLITNIDLLYIYIIDVIEIETVILFQDIIEKINQKRQTKPFIPQVFKQKCTYTCIIYTLNVNFNSLTE